MENQSYQRDMTPLYDLASDWCYPLGKTVGDIAELPQVFLKCENVVGGERLLLFCGNLSNPTRLTCSTDARWDKVVDGVRSSTNREEASDILKIHVAKIAVAHGFAADKPFKNTQMLASAIGRYQREIALQLGSFSKEQHDLFVTAALNCTNDEDKLYPASANIWCSGQKNLTFCGPSTFLNEGPVKTDTVQAIKQKFGNEFGVERDTWIDMRLSPGGCFRRGEVSNQGRTFEILAPRDIPRTIGPNWNTLADAHISRHEIMLTENVRADIDWENGKINGKFLDEHEYEAWGHMLHSITKDEYWQTPYDSLATLCFPKDLHHCSPRTHEK